MPPVNLGFYVNQGRYGITANNNFNFGTEGLGTCVGVIVQLNNGNNFCGHMDHSYEPTQAQRAAFIQQVVLVLQATIPLANVQQVHYSTPGGTRAAQYTVDAIVQQFPNAVNAGARSCIYIAAAGVQATDQNAILGQNVDNGAFGV
jgi:chemotaxis receptor (MCP) glutamine deamidase CheD